MLQKEDVINRRTRTTAHLVGRMAELAVWDAVLGGLDDAMWLVAVTAEPGLGKTRLLDEFRHRAESAGTLVAVAQAAEVHRLIAFATLADALDTLALRHQDRLGSLPEQFAAELVAVMPSVVPPVPVATTPPNRHRLYGALRLLLQHLAGEHKMVLLLDDLHWSDEETIDFLTHLARHPMPDKLIVGLAYRTRQAPNRLARTVDALVTAGGAHKLTLKPLSEQDLYTLIGENTPARTVRELHTTSGGNPLYLTALAERAGWMEPPSDAAIAVGAELSTLTPVVRQVAGAAAVLGDDFDPRLLPAVSALPTVQVEAALDELARRDLVRKSRTDGQLAFRHPLVRHTVYNHAGLGWRGAAHSRAAEALRRAAAPAEVWAHHVAYSARIGDRRAIRVLLRAAVALRWQAPATAAQWYAAALRLLPDEASYRGQRGRLALARAEALLQAGRLHDSKEAFSVSLALLHPHSMRLRCRAVVGAARTAQYLGLYDEAAAALEREINTIAASAPQHQPALWLEVAAVRLAQGDLHRAQIVAEQLDMTAALEDTLSDRASSHAVIGFCLTAAGDLAEGHDHAAAAGWALDAMTDAELMAHLHAVVWTVRTDVCTGRYAQAVRHAARGAVLARTAGSSHLLARLLIGQSEALRMMGRLHEARACAQDVYDVAQTSGTQHLLLTTLIPLIQVMLWQGEVSKTMDLCERAEELAGQETGALPARARAVLGHARFAANDATGCIERVTAAGGGPELSLLDLHDRASWYELLTEAACSLDNVALADEWARWALTAAQQSTLPSAMAFASLAQSHVDLAKGDLHYAGMRTEAAIDAFKQAGNLLEVARARLVRGRVLAAEGRRKAAVDELHAAKVDFAHCGAPRLEDEAIRELRRLGMKVARAGGRGGPGSGLASLSRREREVADHVAQGLTNREVAAWMYLSEKTVERHLSSIFTKLGIRSRVALAMELQPGPTPRNRPADTGPTSHTA
ncbi:AAA family ATPase [Streptomyces sp. NPDC005500]|uniref:helix-turn-helix transcriptional regulator n=1 Tax=Streptomyces sp. NPDC005500 TaxID=3155007 RepID=UPI0033B78BDC